MQSLVRTKARDIQARQLASIIELIMCYIVSVCRLGNHLKMAKTDQERMGLFSEMGYTTIGDPYKSGNVESKRHAPVAV